MNKEEQVNGIDTILGLSGGAMPKLVQVSFNTLYNQTVLQQEWNSRYIALIPYCISCREPLVWHTNPDKVLFHCPKCEAEWVKEKDWEKHKGVIKKLINIVGKDG